MNSLKGEEYRFKETGEYNFIFIGIIRNYIIFLEF